MENIGPLLKVESNHYLTSFPLALRYDIVYADIGGLSGAHGLLESLALIDALEPGAIVIKSLCMKRLVPQLIPFSTVKKQRSLMTKSESLSLHTKQ